MDLGTANITSGSINDTDSVTMLAPYKFDLSDAGLGGDMAIVDLDAKTLGGSTMVKVFDQMRKLKKTGYYIYIVACLIGIIGPLAIIGSGIMGGFILLGSVFSILFIILYGVNLKHLR